MPVGPGGPGPVAPGGPGPVGAGGPGPVGPGGPGPVGPGGPGPVAPGGPGPVPMGLMLVLSLGFSFQLGRTLIVLLEFEGVEVLQLSVLANKLCPTENPVLRPQQMCPAVCLPFLLSLGCQYPPK